MRRGSRQRAKLEQGLGRGLRLVSGGRARLDRRGRPEAETASKPGLLCLIQNHCRHCIRVFCVNCLSHTVASGPNHRPSKVCDVCHTLLDRDTAPYFSTDPPHSND
ncbi:effector protein 1 [Homalodisca vitripennis]|nr:effector protein 1 [Homalodisca vitripennis]